ncbi:tripartite tricarboxylate transporter permease [Allorhizocola rhizosphaerae]|uniref:tripartite tricarboxylate transporter permease n=1 Tax=Allorhizocola rhizosphaerae TaxID=1872709 RepID=UPI001FEB1CDB|nr:tripartite tricarboxylate transporter permease [Allorhizocola rhizosphaerae]
MIRIWVKVLQIPRPILYTGILVFATLGVYAVSGNIEDVLIAFAIGVVAMFMRHLDFPIAPVILGVILGPMMETQFRRALLLADNDLSIFVRRPLTLTLPILAVVLALALPFVPRLFGRKEKLALAEDD